MILFILLFNQSLWASSAFQNTDSLRRIYNFGQKISVKKSLKVAVLDKSFFGYEKEIGQSLPSQTQYIPGPVAAPADMKLEHGLRMAQIFWDLATHQGQTPEVISEFRLYNVYGFSNFKAAIESLIRDQFDLVLYSEVWEFGNNFDGGGFINAQVRRATEAGITWINAAGNFGLTTFNYAVVEGKDSWLKLPDTNDSLALRCEDNPQKKCVVKIVLSWNDFKDDPEIGSDKDLDLALTDDMLSIVQVSRLKQSTAAETKPGESKYPREIISAELKPGSYFIRVKRMSDNFSKKDRLRITVDGDSISVPSARIEETLLNPADLSDVIAVGALDSARTGISRKLKKPDVWALSSILLPDEKEFRGTSNSAAIVAAAATRMKSQKPELSRKDLLKEISFPLSWREKSSLSLSQLGFQPTKGACFKESFTPKLPEHIQILLARGAKLVETNYGQRLMVPYDPMSLDRNLRRQSVNDLVLMTPHGLKIQRRFTLTAANEIEVFQTPSDSGPCVIPQQELYVLY